MCEYSVLGGGIPVKGDFFIFSFSLFSPPCLSPPTVAHHPSPFSLRTSSADTPAVHEEKGACFRLVSSGKQCLHPVSAQLSKQLCCCSVGKAWGPRCDKCPLPGTGKVPNASNSESQALLPIHPFHYSHIERLKCGTSGIHPPPTLNCRLYGYHAKFKEICPGGMGYTVMGSYKPKAPNQLPKLPSQPETINKPMITHQEPVAPPLPLPTPEKPVEALSVAERQLPSVPEVVEKTSPPAPALILPTNAGQDIAPTQSAEVDECKVNPHICGQGICYNTVEGYNCICNEGYQMDETHTTCVDVDECLESASLCSNGRCKNTPGSFLCVCQPGFMTDEEGTSCIDLNECLNPNACHEDGFCVNNVGSYSCQHCDSGYRMSPTGQCEDVDECSDGTRCVGSSCENSQGSYRCQCDSGYRLQADTDTCLDIDECSELGQSICGAWQCENTEGSYRCVVDCPPGHNHGPEGICVDIDECNVNATVCGSHGFCENTVGSFRCLCDRGYQESQEGLGCVGLGCGGSLSVMHGFHFSPGLQWIQRCCVLPADVNECDLLSGVCGEALCENVEGSFLCMCPDEDQEYNQMTAKCSPAPTASSVERKECYYNLNDENLCENVLTSSVTIEECCCTLGAGWGDNCEVHPCPIQGTDQFSQMCPAGRGSVPTGDPVFGVTAAESYKDADECALFGQEICKDGFCFNSPGSYECYCKNGLHYDEVGSGPAERQGGDTGHSGGDTGLDCGDLWAKPSRPRQHVPNYQPAHTGGTLALCRPHTAPLSPGRKRKMPVVRLRCSATFVLDYLDRLGLGGGSSRDIDECQDESSCVAGECLNTHGSYMCFCTHPMVMDSDNKSCVIAPEVAEQHGEQTVYQGICWQTVTDNLTDILTCTKPLANRKTTYTECCCLFGEAWGMDCTLCPLKNTEDYASMCNVAMSGGQGRPYGGDALVPRPVQDYEPHPDHPGALYEDKESK
ncbi:unnamed protein product [Coregonus sp. 'balchen']|nr:unnamed protein product [Coregonus sp. 'balchen']